MKVGTQAGSRALAQRMGIRTQLSTNPAMTLGGLKEGVTPLEMAYAYSTIANGGERVSGTLGPPTRPAPVGDRRRSRAGRDGNGRRRTRRRARARVPARRSPQVARRTCSATWSSERHRQGRAGRRRVRLRARPARPRTTATPGSSAATTSSRSPSGSATRTSSSRWRPSTTASPVAGGTFPAEIWHDFMTSWLEMRDAATAAAARAPTDDEDAPRHVPPTPAPRTRPPTDQPPPDARPPPTDQGGGQAGAAGARADAAGRARADPGARRPRRPPPSTDAHAAHRGGGDGTAAPAPG